MKKNLAQWLSWQETLHLSEIDLGLDRIRVVAKALDLLSPTFPIITVAGTNGKGSSVAMLDAILRAQGYKTGNYTSPHLVHYNERIKLGGLNVSDQKIVSAFEKIDLARGETSLTYFEFSTLAAMLIFNNEKVDVAILEVGLGGRLDAANLWDASLAIISSIAVDHVAWLGDDREKIAIEKAGIMRKNTPVISGEPNPPSTIASEAQRIGAQLSQINTDFFYESTDQDSWLWKSKDKQLKLSFPALKGEFQLSNASTVIAGLLTIKSILPVSDNAIKKGLETALAEGRLQVISNEPEWLIDVAHNPHAALELAKYLHKKPVMGKTYALFSMLRDKDIKTVVAIMQDAIDEWHIVGLGGSRGINLNELKQEITQQSTDTNNRAKIIEHQTIDDACASLKNISKSKDRVVAFGSFLVVSDVIEIFAQKS